MAKRFTDTEIWDKEWFTKLSLKEKCLVRYLFDKCDNAGVWAPNWPIASAYLGEPVKVEDLANFSSRLDFIGEKIFVVDFIEFQYGKLTEDCKPHRPIIQKLKKYGLYERVMKGYCNPSERVEEKEEEQDQDNDQEKIYGRTENLFFGNVPADLVELSARLKPTEKAGEWQDYVQSEIETIGYRVAREVPVTLDGDRNGRIDLVAEGKGVVIAIELDYRTPRAKSIEKVKRYPAGMVILRDPKIIAVQEQWKSMPTPVDIPSLDDSEVTNTVEFIHRLKKELLTQVQVNEFWQAFKIVALTGKKFYPNREDVITHFRNWLKNQDGNKSKTGAAGNIGKLGTSEARVKAAPGWGRGTVEKLRGGGSGSQG